MLNILKKIILFSIIFLSLSCNTFLINNVYSANKNDANKKELIKLARRSLFQLKNSIKNDGFFCSRVALNVWKLNATEAGKFKKKEYEKYKNQIYEKSIKMNLQFFNSYLAQKHYKYANTCLQIWSIHAKEIGQFSQKKYNEMEKKLKKIK